VLRFSVGRNWLATLDSLSFVRDTKDFRDFVAYCRTPLWPHRPRGKNYAVVFGPVTVMGGRKIIQDGDQISFHDPNLDGDLTRALKSVQGVP
jgi:hypothetical protein